MEPNRQMWWIRMGVLFIAVVLLATAPHSIAAQAQAPQQAPSELQQLKDHLQQLDEVMQQLKGQINALEAGQNGGGSIPYVPTQTSDSAATGQTKQSLTLT